MNNLSNEQIKLLNWAIAKGIAALNAELKNVEEEGRKSFLDVVGMSANNPFSSTQKAKNLKQAQSKLAISSTKKEFLELKKKNLEALLKVINS